MMFCPNCGKEIPDDSTFCQECGLSLRTMPGSQGGSSGEGAPPRKRRKLPFIIGGAGVLLVVILVIAFRAGGSDTSSNTGDVSGTVNLDDTSPTDTNRTGGNPTEGEGASQAATDGMTIADRYSLVGESLTDENSKFTLSEDSIKFMDAHPDFFPGSESNLDAILAEVDPEVGFPQVHKNPAKYDDTLMAVSGLVIDCRELEYDFGTVTYIHVLDEVDEYSYCVYYLGTLDDVVDGCYVSCYVLPFGVITFKNLEGTNTLAVVGAACYCSLEEGVAQNEDPMEAALEQYALIVNQAPEQFESIDDSIPTGNYYYALVQMEPSDMVPTLLLEQETDSGIYYVRIFQYDMENGIIIEPDDILMEGTASAGGYRGGLSMERDGYGIREFEMNSGTGETNIRRVTLENGLLIKEDQWSGLFGDEVPSELDPVDIEWQDSADMSAMDYYEAYSGNSYEEDDEEEESTYMLPDVDSRYYTEEELQWIVESPEDVRLCINELYARHGYIFNSEEWNDYFSSQDWYHGTTPADEFDDSVFNEYERANLELLKEMENESN